MSVVQMAQVFARSQSKGAARLVLLALADVAAESGEISAYKRSYPILAGKANCGEATVRRAITDLVELGELEVTEPGGGRKSASYRITLPSGADEHGPDDHPARAGGPARVVQMSTQGGPDDHSIIPSLPLGDPSGSTQVQPSLAAGFESFWREYPRHVDRRGAELAWAKAVKIAHASVIVTGAARYAAETKGRDTSKIAHPTTWLHHRRWEDEPGANASSKPAPARGAAAPVTADRTAPEGRIKL